MRRTFIPFLLMLSAGVASAQFPFKLEGARDDRATALAFDGDGSVVVAVGFQAIIDFDPSSARTVSLGSGVNQQLALAKYRSDGALVWAKLAGGNASVTVEEIVIDDDGNIHVAGWFGTLGAPFVRTLDCDLGPDTVVLRTTGGVDPFFAKYDRDGNLRWARSLGRRLTRITDEFLWDLAVDADGGVYLTGDFSSDIDLDAGPDSNIVDAESSGTDGWVAKYDSTGAHVWSFRFGGPANDAGRSIALDDEGFVHLGGYFEGTADFDPDPRFRGMQAIGSASDLFIVRYTTDGAFDEQIRIGGERSDLMAAGALRRGRDGTLVIAGMFSDRIDLEPGIDTLFLGTTRTTGAADRLFVAAYGADLGLRWGRWLESDGGVDAARSIAIDDEGSIYVSGYYSGRIDMSGGAGSGVLQSVNLMEQTGDGFVAKYDAGGNLVWSHSLGGRVIGENFYNAGHGIALDRENRPFVAGEFYGTADFDPGDGKLTFSSFGGADAFVAGYTADGELIKTTVGIGERTRGAIVRSMRLAPSVTAGATTVHIALQAPKSIAIDVVDVLGRTIRRERRSLDAGEQAIALDLSSVPSGIYRVRLDGATAVLRVAR